MMAVPEQLAVLVVDDHELVRTGMRMLLEGNAMIGEVLQASSGEAAIALAEERKAQQIPFDLVLMDVLLPGINGLEATRRLLAINSGTAVIIVSGGELESRNVQQLLDCGVRGYVTKGSSGDEMDRAIREVVSGGKYLSVDVAQSVTNQAMDGDQENPFERLSAREMEIVELLLEGQRNRLIAEKLHISEKTVSTHRTRAYEKLGVGTPAELVRLAIRFGLWSDA